MTVEEEAAELTRCPREDHGRSPCFCAEKSRSAVAERLRQRDERIAALEAALDEVLRASKTICARGHDSICDCGGDEARAALAGRKT